MDDSEDSTGEIEDVDKNNSEKPNLSFSSSSEISFAAVDEFQSIGLRPMEFRPDVIRSAMKRSALPLAELHLNHPGGAVERRLTQIVTTGYRLLDPRRREDTLQRMMLGRIHPQLADELVRETQAKGQALMAPDAIDEMGLDLEPALLPARTPGLGPFPLTSKGSFLANDLSSTWSQSLQSEDLLVDRPIRRAFRATRAWATMRLVPIAASIGFIAVAFGAWSGFRNGENHGVARSSLADVNTESNLVAVGPAPTLLAETAMAPIDEKTPDLIVTDSAISKTSLPAKTTDAPVSSQVAADLAEQSLVQVSPPVAPIANDVLQPTVPSSPSMPPTIDRSESIAPPSKSIARIESSLSPAQRATVVNVDIEDVIGVKTKLPVPSESDLVEAVEAMDQVLSKLGTSDWGARKKASLDLAQSSQGSDDPLKFFASLRGAAGYSVLAGDYLASDSAMLAIAERFDTSLEAIALNISPKLVGLARLDSDMRNVVLWLGTCTARSLVAGKLDHAEQFASLLSEIAETLDDEAAMERSKEFSKALVSFRRFEAIAVALDSKIGRDVNESDHFAAGRYWALVRRDWVKALPHLSAGSDIRLAALASSELLMGGMPDSEDVLELATGYLALAEKSKGWMADSYALHAAEILRLETTVNSSARDLELQRIRSKISDQFASAFSLEKRMKVVEGQAFGATVDQNLIGSNQIQSSQPVANPLVPAFAGKILLNGEDLGVHIRYEPGVVLSTSIYAQIEQRAKVCLSDASMELSGIIHVERPTAIMVQVTAPSGPNDQTVTIDGKSLVDTEVTSSFAASVTTYRADLDTGTWTLRWNVPKLVNGLSLRIIDGLSGSPISLMNTTGQDDVEGSDHPPRLRVKIASGR